MTYNSQMVTSSNTYWLVVLSILKNMKVKWDDDIPKSTNQTTSHGKNDGKMMGQIWKHAGKLMGKRQIHGTTSHGTNMELRWT